MLEVYKQKTKKFLLRHRLLRGFSVSDCSEELITWRTKRGLSYVPFLADSLFNPCLSIFHLPFIYSLSPRAWFLSPVSHCLLLTETKPENGTGGPEQLPRHKESAMTVTFSSVKPQMFVQAPTGADAIHFYKTTFGAEQMSISMHPKRKTDQELPLSSNLIPPSSSSPSSKKTLPVL